MTKTTKGLLLLGAGLIGLAAFMRKLKKQADQALDVFPIGEQTLTPAERERHERESK